MTTRAYQEIYLNKAQSTLGDAFDYAVNLCHIAGPQFAAMFVVSSVSKKMENGEPAMVVGKSGIEIAREVVRETKGIELQTPPEARYGRSVAYWVGRMLAYYQWYSGRNYADILTAISYDELEIMYQTLHEADVSKFTENADDRLKEVFPETNLGRIRKRYGITQAELAKRAGIGLRSVQMYEQRNKNINKAGAEVLYQMSKVLACMMEDLMEAM